MDPERLALFIPTFFLVSVSPGLCMTLAMTLGMRVGLRRTCWMMGGEVLGVTLVALAALAGGALIAPVRIGADAIEFLSFDDAKHLSRGQ